MKKNKKHIWLSLFILFTFSAFSNLDSLFVAQVKQYAIKEFGYAFNSKLYTKWESGPTPYLCLFVSDAKKVERAPGFANPQYEYPFVYCKSESDGERKLNQWQQKGFHAYIYKAYANSGCTLNSHFLGYTNETKCFIVFHELLHNYIFDEKINIPYDLHEALGDVIANYATLNYCQISTQMNIGTVKKQSKVNEDLYRCFNKCILKINNGSKKVDALHTKCNKQVQKILQNADQFQKERFDYKVNNAYLLKNMNYCLNYFLLQKVLIKQGSIKKLLELIKTLPANKTECMKLLKKST